MIFHESYPRPLFYYFSIKTYVIGSFVHTKHTLTDSKTIITILQLKKNLLSGPRYSLVFILFYIMLAYIQISKIFECKYVIIFLHILCVCFGSEIRFFSQICSLILRPVLAFTVKYLWKLSRCIEECLVHKLH